jgi:F420-dependent hydroxymycolic acid dehydrogenase
MNKRWYFQSRIKPATYRLGKAGYPDPVEIQRQAESEVRLEEVIAEWVVGTDPAVHLAMIRDLFDSGVAIVNVHSGQADLRKVIEFYGRSVLGSLEPKA